MPKIKSLTFFLLTLPKHFRRQCHKRTRRARLLLQLLLLPQRGQPLAHQPSSRHRSARQVRRVATSARQSARVHQRRPAHRHVPREPGYHNVRRRHFNLLATGRHRFQGRLVRFCGQLELRIVRDHVKCVQLFVHILCR